MTPGEHGRQWQEIGWNGLAFRVRSSWQPTVIRAAYLFFEQGGRPVFEIKWQDVRGRFSAAAALKQLSDSLRNGTMLQPWDLPSDRFQVPLAYTVSGFGLRRADALTHGLLLYDAAGGRAILAQWHFDAEQETEPAAHFLETLHDQRENSDQLWALYDIRIWLPGSAKLTNHEFVPGRYILSFACQGTSLILYRYKPAAILLQHESLGGFGRKLLAAPPVEEGNGWALWKVKMKGPARLLAQLRRQPAEQWMRLWHEPEQNVILGVRADGKGATAAPWLDQICSGFTSIPSA